ncbi:hypothetical protein AAZX31_13G321500 [Glycine max]|nr:hypothetical protein GLYMA_13G340250v4 [Glycine max]KAH1104766.1 hypothetical protein GYH30_038232 [Glycine max]
MSGTAMALCILSNLAFVKVFNWLTRQEMPLNILSKVGEASLFGTAYVQS